MSAKARAFQIACRSRHSSNSSKTIATRYQNAAPTPEQAHQTRSFSSQSSLYATSKSTSGTSSTTGGSTRRAITVTTDDGRYNWSDLSTGEKAARTTQQTYNSVLVGAALLGSCLVSYYLYTDLFSPSSYTVLFNSAVNRIKASPECRSLLGPSSKIVAFGEPTSNKWARARPIAHSEEQDRFGTTHVRMHFNVEGTEGRGVVTAHLSRTREMEESGESMEWRLLSLSVPGKETVYLENKDAGTVKGKVGRMFGVQWR